MPSLEALLSGGRYTLNHTHGYTRTLLNMLGLGLDDLPVAALSRLGATGKQDGQWWMKTDPVHFITNLTDVVLDDPKTLQLSRKESEQLLATVQKHTQQDGWHCEMLSPQEWVIRLDHPRTLIVEPTDSVIGRNVLDHLPRGEEGGYWRQCMNEIQMLLHDHPINVVREENGLAEANGLWLWGGGQISLQNLAHWKHFFCDDALSVGLAKNNGIPQSSGASYSNSGWQDCGEGNILWAVQQPSEATWADYLLELDRSFFQSVLTQLQGGQLHSVVLYPAPGSRYDVCRARPGLFWKRKKPLNFYIKQQDIV
ncbi:MAG: hypothetical protein GXP09_06200 [Gammaproteobacteria bacterium]|nr:hypothetical protein [Gammaproteobacteria bacterium]